MEIAYVFYLVALLQVSLCQNDTTEFTTVQSTTGFHTSLESLDKSTEPTIVVSESTTEQDNEETENVRYQTEGQDSTTTTNSTTNSTDQPKPEPSTTSSPSHAASVVTPAVALAGSLLLGVRLFSKLHGLV